MEKSIYSSAFNLIKNNFNYEFHLANFCCIAEEVVIAVNTSEDNTLEELRRFAKNSDLPKLRILSCDFSYEDPQLDGKIKNFALQNTTKPAKINLDMDEYIPFWQKELWDTLYERYASFFDFKEEFSFFVPSLNLYKDVNHFYDINKKWYFHGVNCHRGVVNFAKLENGRHDISKSDSCELIDADGNLVKTYDIISHFGQLEESELLSLLESKIIPFVVHTGYLNIEDRITRNKNFWERHWSLESGKEVSLPKKQEDFDKPYKHHNLDLGFER